MHFVICAHMHAVKWKQITTEKASEPTVLARTQVGTLDYYHKKSSHCHRSSFCCT